jgi:hypothetical protein
MLAISMLALSKLALAQLWRSPSYGDLLFRFMPDYHADHLQLRFNVALQAINIINELCMQPLVLRDWSFSELHCYLTMLLLGAFTGFVCMQTCTLESGPFTLLPDYFPASSLGRSTLPEHDLLPDAQQGPF